MILFTVPVLPRLRSLTVRCGIPQLSRREADDPLKMKAEMALVREAGAERDVGHAEPAACQQEFLRSLDTARDHILVRRQPGGRLELPREVIGAEMHDGRHLLQRCLKKMI